MNVIGSAGRYFAGRSALSGLRRPLADVSGSCGGVRMISLRHLEVEKEEIQKKRLIKQVHTQIDPDHPLDAPGWDPHAATASEEAVKADRATKGSKEHMEKFAVEHAQKKAKSEEGEGKVGPTLDETDEENQARYDKEELEGPLKSARGE